MDIYIWAAVAALVCFVIMTSVLVIMCALKMFKVSDDDEIDSEYIENLGKEVMNERN